MFSMYNIEFKLMGLYPVNTLITDAIHIIISRKIDSDVGIFYGEWNKDECSITFRDWKEVLDLHGVMLERLTKKEYASNINKCY